MAPNNNVLYINNQDNTFTEKSAEFGSTVGRYNVCNLPFLIIQGRFDLDLYVINIQQQVFTAPDGIYQYIVGLIMILRDSDSSIE